MNIHDMVFYTNEPGETMLLKSDWVAIVIAVLGTAVVTYYGWDSRHENPTMKKILYTLLTLMFILLMMCIYLMVSVNG
jgi:glucan phosphoethanolaminetransferase (alkaline phosphatase superfamily)